MILSVRDLVSMQIRIWQIDTTLLHKYSPQKRVPYGNFQLYKMYLCIYKRYTNLNYITIIMRCLTDFMCLIFFTDVM